MYQAVLPRFGLFLVAMLVLSSCSAEGPTQVPSTIAPRPPTSSANTPSTKPRGESATPDRNDLPRGRTTRTIQTSRIRITLEYAIETRIDKWEPGVPQPIMVNLTAVRDGRPTQRIYLAKVTGVVRLADDVGSLQAPEPLVDQPNVLPGYLVTSPTTYNEVFVLEPLPDEATKVIIDFRYELLFLEQDSTPRDYAKRTVTDRLVLTR